MGFIPHIPARTGKRMHKAQITFVMPHTSVVTFHLRLSGQCSVHPILLQRLQFPYHLYQSPRARHAQCLILILNVRRGQERKAGERGHKISLRVFGDSMYSTSCTFRK